MKTLLIISALLLSSLSQASTVKSFTGYGTADGVESGTRNPCIDQKVEGPAFFSTEAEMDAENKAYDNCNLANAQDCKTVKTENLGLVRLDDDSLACAARVTVTGKVR